MFSEVSAIPSLSRSAAMGDSAPVAVAAAAPATPPELATVVAKKRGADEPAAAPKRRQRTSSTAKEVREQIDAANARAEEEATRRVELVEGESDEEDKAPVKAALRPLPLRRLLPLPALFRAKAPCWSCPTSPPLPLQLCLRSPRPALDQACSTTSPTSPRSASA